MSRRPNRRRNRRPTAPQRDPQHWRDATRDTLWQRLKRWWRVIRNGF